MALSRSVHECYIRFIYLVRHEHELEDWFKWQLSRDFQFDCDRLDYDDGLKWNAKEELLREKRRIEELFGDAPSKGKPKWKTMSEMLKDVVEDDPPGTERRLYRYLISYPSTYVHPRTSAQPDPDLVLKTTIESVLGTLKEAMKLSYSKRIAEPTTINIEEWCDRIRTNSPSTHKA